MPTPVEIAVIEVDEDDTNSAIGAALAKADRGVNWDLMRFDPDVYTPHVELYLSADDAEDFAGSTSKAALKKTLNRVLSVQAERFGKYLLLYADTNAGEGKVLFQPWFLEQPVDLLPRARSAASPNRARCRAAMMGAR